MDKKIKILFLINHFKRGGSPRVFLNQINELNKRDYDVYLATAMKFNKKASFLHELNIFPEKVKFFEFKNIFDLKSYLHLRRFIRENDIAIVYSTLDIANSIARAIKLISPQTITVIRESGMADRKGFGSKIFDIVFNFFTDIIIAQTEDLKKSLLAYQKMHKNKIVILGNGIEARQWDEIVAVREKIKNKEEFVILNIGTMRTHDKGQQELLAVFRKLIHSMPGKNLKLILIGDGILRRKYERYVKESGLCDWAEFTGKMDHKEVEKHYLKADAYITLSKTEGFSNTVLEAMSFGLPVISTKVSGAIEAIEGGKSGFLVDVGDQKKLIAKTARLIQDGELRKKIGREAHNRVKEKYSLKKQIDGLLTIFNQL